MAQTVSQVLALIGIVCWSLVLVPQIIYNKRRHSTAGFSKTLTLTLMLSGFLWCSYFIYVNAQVAVLCQMLIFLFFAALIFAQIFYYHNKSSEPVILAQARPSAQANNTAAPMGPNASDLAPAVGPAHATVEPQPNLTGPPLFGETPHRFSAFRFVCALLILISILAMLTGLIFLFNYLFHLSDDRGNTWAPFAFGSIFPTVVCALGFLPQMYKFYQVKNSNGYSIWLSILDVIGCVFGILSVVLSNLDWGVIIPYMIIGMMHSILLFLAIVIYPKQPEKRSATTFWIGADGKFSQSSGHLQGDQKPRKQSPEIPAGRNGKNAVSPKSRPEIPHQQDEIPQKDVVIPIRSERVDNTEPEQWMGGRGTSDRGLSGEGLRGGHGDGAINPTQHNHVGVSS